LFSIALRLAFRLLGARFGGKSGIGPIRSSGQERSMRRIQNAASSILCEHNPDRLPLRADM
jgi:hypothetical protein